jgi:hypothetical protein
MEASMSDHEITFGPADFERVTGGWITGKTLQNWRHARQWLTPTPEVSGVVPYPHCFAHLAEAALVARLHQHGVDQVLARAIIKRRLVERAFEVARGEHKGGPRGVWEGDVSEAIKGLPEFEKGGPRFWLIVLSPAPRGGRPTPMAVIPMRGTEEIGERMTGAEGVVAPVAIVLDVGGIIDELNAVRAEKASA